MKVTAKRKNQSATRLEKLKQVKLIIKTEEHLEEVSNASVNRNGYAATSSLDTVVKVEEKDAILKNQLPRSETERGLCIINPFLTA